MLTRLAGENAVVPGLPSCPRMKGRARAAGQHSSRPLGAPESTPRSLGDVNIQEVASWIVRLPSLRRQFSTCSWA